MTGCRTSRVAWPALPLLACGLLLPSGVSAWPVHAGAEFRVNTTIQGAQASPSVASDAAGNFVVVWDTHIAQPPETYEQWVRGQRYGADGMPIGGEFQINASTLGSNETPAVAMDPGGPFVVAWARGDLVTGDWSIWVRRFDASGAPLGLESQASSTSGDLRVPGIAALPGGGFVVVWQGFGAGDPDGYGIFARIFDVTGTPVTGDFVVNTYTTDYQWYPSVASAPTGDFVVVWERSFKSVLAARRFDATGTPLGGEFVPNVVSQYERGSSPGVGMGPNGEFVIVWNNSITIPLYFQSWDVFARRYDASGAPLGAGFAVGPSGIDPPADFQPRIAFDGGGGFVVAWAEWHDYDAVDVFGRRYDAAGTPRDASPFPVNTYTTHQQSDPEIAATDADGFVTVWYSWGQDGEYSGIYGQRFLGPDATTTSTSTSSTTTTSATTSSTTSTLAECPNVGGNAFPLMLEKTKLRFLGPGEDRFLLKATFTTFVAIDPATTHTTYLTVRDGTGAPIWTSGPIAPDGPAWERSYPSRGRFRYRDPLAALVPGLFKMAITERPLGSRTYKLAVTGKAATLLVAPPTSGVPTVVVEMSLPLCMRGTPTACVKKPTVETCR